MILGYNLFSADLTACGRFINAAKTSKGPVSAEAGFFVVRRFKHQLAGRNTKYC